MYLCLLLAAAVAAKQDLYKTSSKDQTGENDHVTSILVQPGPDGPRHVILSDEQQQSFLPREDDISSRTLENSYHFSSVDYAPQSREYGHSHSLPPPTYGPARPVDVRGRRGQLYHLRGKAPPHAKPSHGLSDAIYKYSTYIKHDKAESDKPYVTDHREPVEGLSAYKNRPDNDVMKYPDVYENDFERYEKQRKPLPFSKLYLAKQHNYIPIGESKYFRGKNYENRYNAFEEDYPEKQIAFDDTHGGRAVPSLARFYKQPLPVIQTQLPADNKGLFLQYFSKRPDLDERTERSVRYQSSESEWMPINAPSGAVPAKSYTIQAPDLSQVKHQLPVHHQLPVQHQFNYQRTPEPAVVVGKNKRPSTSNRHIQANSEGVVSAVVRVKQ